MKTLVCLQSILAQIQQISDIGLFFAYLILLLPLTIILLLKLNLFKDVIVAVVRMSFQLFIVGILLIYLFKWNNTLLNLLWFLIMILFATYSVIRNSNLRLRSSAFPVLLALMIVSFLVVLYFNALILGIDNVFQAQFLIVLSGMILGNSMRGTIIGISGFYKDLRRNEDRYLHRIAHGATVFEAVKPYYRNAIESAIRPTVAAMSTIGIVFLPGMMAGQILGGASPDEAIKYQIA
ncbi:MAG: ABC transporter permease, partial [Candidatus Heimdallarchaeota archaeon]|nr:ABC transporter permease [Candidatus Heimdallarchaeota archaeon]